MASPNTISLHGNLSLFSCQGAEIYSHSAFFFGEVLPGLETKLGIRRGSPEFEKSRGASWKVRLQLRRVVRTACHPKPDSRSDGILLSNVPPVNEIMLWAVGYSRQDGRGVRAIALKHYLRRSRLQAAASRAVFCWAV